jgi:hypothetical protein|eukprot:COSAG01_NODE_3420_length_6118_cov_2.065459_5_plen_356_part_00
MIAPGAAVAPALSLPADYVLLRKATLRNGPKLDSKEVGILQAGYIVNIVGESYQDGHHRLHLPVGVTTSGGGWVSRTTAKGGTLLMAVRERPAAVIYTAINVATVRSCASTGSSELYRVGAGKRVVVLETTTFQGHHRARIGVGEWVSLVTAKGKQLMVMDEQATAELRRRAGGAPTAMAVAVPAVVVAASTPVVATATATAMPVAAQATQAVAAMPAPARAEPAAQPPGAAPVAPDGNVIGTQYLTLSGVRLRKDIAVSSECVGTIGAGQQVTVVEQRDWEVCRPWRSRSDCDGPVQRLFLSRILRVATGRPRGTRARGSTRHSTLIRCGRACRQRQVRWCWNSLPALRRSSPS